MATGRAVWHVRLRLLLGWRWHVIDQQIDDVLIDTGDGPETITLVVAETCQLRPPWRRPALASIWDGDR